MAASLAPLTEQHLDAILAIQARSPEAAQWSRESYTSLLGAGARGWVANLNGATCGFLVARIAAGEMEILNLAVDPVHRRQVIGSLLLQATFTNAKRESVTKIHLEVRASNQAARSFYEANGFRQVGLRPNYYRDPIDAALLLAADVA